MRSTRLKVTVVVVGLFALLVPGAKAEGSGPTDARCYFETVLHQSYGLTLENHRSNFHSDKGSITCSGTVEGAEISGDGTVWFTGQAETGCASGSGTLQVGVQIPTLDGVKTMTGKGTFTRVGLTGRSVGTMSDGSSFDGPFVAQPVDDGDCANEAVKDVLLRQVLVVGA